MSENEPVDPIEYIDDQVRLLKVELRQLYVSLLKTQQEVAASNVVDTYNLANNLLLQQRPDLHARYSSQLIAECSAARSEASVSEKPLDVSSKFRDTCKQLLNRCGIKYIYFPPATSA